MVKYKYMFFFIILLLISVSTSSYAMDSFEENAWIGAFFFKQGLSENEKFLPFVDIREIHYKGDSAEDYFKTFLADYILMCNTKLYQKVVGLDVNSRDELREYINILKLEDINLLAQEVNLILKLREEMLDKYEKLSANMPGNVFYRFYHIELIRFEEVTLENLKTDLIRGAYTKKFEIDNNEFPGSKVFTRKINNLMPITGEKLKGFLNSPLVSVRYNYYSEEAKEKFKNELNNPVFIKKEFVNVRELRIRLQDLKEIYDYLMILDNQVLHDLIRKGQFIISNKELTVLLKEYAERR